MNLPTSWIDLGNPKPRDRVADFRPIVWPAGVSITLPSASVDVDAQGNGQTTATFRQVVMRRRSRRTFGALTRLALSQLLEMTCRTQRVSNLTPDLQLSQRPVPSGGAIHPIHLLVLEPGAQSVLRYDPMGHALVTVPSKVDPDELRMSIAEVVDPQQGCVVLLAAEPDRTAAKYESSASVVWRDAGVLIGALALGAESLGLAHCPLGITGEPFVSRLVDQAALVGVGVMLLGARTD